MKSKKRITLISLIVAGIAAVWFMGYLVLQTADPILFDIATKNDTPEQKAAEKERQEAQALPARVFWNLVDIRLEKEEAKREARSEAGLPVRGKDTMLIWRDKYDICKAAETIVLRAHTDSGAQVVLDNVRVFEVEKQTLYVRSDDGYAVIDDENCCRVYIATSKEDPEYSAQHYGSIDDTDIRHLNAYEEFSDSEKEVFARLEHSDEP